MGFTDYTEVYCGIFYIGILWGLLIILWDILLRYTVGFTDYTVGFTEVYVSPTCTGGCTSEQ